MPRETVGTETCGQCNDACGSRRPQRHSAPTTATTYRHRHAGKLLPLPQFNEGRLRNNLETAARGVHSPATKINRQPVLFRQVQHPRLRSLRQFAPPQPRLVQRIVTTTTTTTTIILWFQQPPAWPPPLSQSPSARQYTRRRLFSFICSVVRQTVERGKAEGRAA